MRIQKLVMAALMVIIHHHSMKQTSVLRPEGDGEIHQKSFISILSPFPPPAIANWAMYC